MSELSVGITCQQDKYIKHSNQNSSRKCNYLTLYLLLYMNLVHLCYFIQFPISFQGPIIVLNVAVIDSVIKICLINK